MDLVWLQGFKQIRVSTFYNPYKRSCMKWYRQAATGCLLSVHTNTIAGAWTHAMAGIQVSNFAITGLKRLMPEV